MHLCSTLVTILVTAASAAHPQVEILKSRILANLEMAGLPDISAVNTSESEMQRMMKKFQMRVRRSTEKVITYFPEACVDEGYVVFLPKLRSGTAFSSARLKFPDNTTRDVSDWARQWQQSRFRYLHVPCGERHCCRTQLEFLIRRPPAKQRPTCDKQCCRRPLKVSLKDIGFDWILHPKEFNAFYCSGGCKKETTNFASTHAFMQAVLSDRGRKKLPEPCCIPKKMEPLEMMHYNDHDPPELVFTTHKGMIVEECFCA